jgi:hypothetical protein
MSECVAYLCGYSGRDPSWLLSACLQLDCVVFDVRFSPSSHRPEWSKANLETLLGTRYRHAPGFGNNLYRTHAIDLADPEASLAAFDRETGPVILLCQCRESATCHRMTVAAYLAEQRGVTVHELDDAFAESAARQLPIFAMEEAP